MTTLRSALAVALLALAAPAWGKGPSPQTFTPAHDLDAADQPESKRQVGHLKAGASYQLLKRGGPGGNWCKVQLDGAAGWVVCSDGASGAEAGSPQAPAPQPQPGNAPPPAADGQGAFDYYVLSLSWSPTFCEAKGAKAPEQCGPGRHFAFVVHGLWPQNEKGWPESCPMNDRPSSALVDQMLDLMPSRQLIAHEWEKHGTCSGLSAADYFGRVRQAYGSLHIPPAFVGPKQPFTTDLASIQKAFQEANPGLTADEFAVQCKGELDEVRVCLDRQLKPRPCSKEVRSSCKGQVYVRPMR